MQKWMDFCCMQIISSRRSRDVDSLCVESSFTTRGGKEEKNILPPLPQTRDICVCFWFYFSCLENTLQFVGL